MQELKLMRMVVLAKMQVLMEQHKTAFPVENPEVVTKIRLRHKLERQRQEELQVAPDTKNSHQVQEGQLHRQQIAP